MELNAVTEDDCCASGNNARRCPEGVLLIYGMDQRSILSCHIDFPDTPFIKCDFSHRSRSSSAYLGTLTTDWGRFFHTGESMRRSIPASCSELKEFDPTRLSEPAGVAALWSAKLPAGNATSATRANPWSAQLNSQRVSYSKFHFLHKEEFYG